MGRKENIVHERSNYYFETKGEKKNWINLLTLLNEYQVYKGKYVRQIMFDPDSADLTQDCEAPLKVIQIIMETATYDEIEQDRKMTPEGQIGLIGGTLGLFTGFSVLCGVDIFYYAIKMFASV